MLSKIKELTKDTAIYGISTIVGRFIGFILVPFYTNVINTNDFGIYSNVYAYIAFLNVIFIYGMDAAFMKYASLTTADERKNIFSTSFWFIMFSTVLFSVFLLLLKTPLKSAIEIPQNFSNLYYYLILILFLDTVALIPFAKLRLERKAIKFAVIKLINIFLNLSLNLYLILKLKMGIEAIFISNLIASLFSVVVLLPEIFHSIRFKIDKAILNKLLKFGIPYLPGSLSAMIVQVIDRPIVLALTDASTLGIYQANYKLGIFMMLIVSMFNYAWQPFFLNNAQEKNAKELFSKIFTLFLLFTSLLWIILSLFIDDFAKFKIFDNVTIIGKAYLGGLVIVPIILLGYLFNGLYVNFTAGIYIEEKTKYFPIVTGSGALVNVVVNFMLIPVIGIVGAALATLASYMVMAGGLFFFSQKFYKINYEYKKIIKILTLIFITAGLYYLFYYTIGIFFTLKLLLLILFVSSLFIMNVIELSEVKKLTKLLLGKVK
ncbi:polysaccharide biosynthesis C-terminal domain-containing protein [Melioribacteraceae bacterium 4301-Me]|uniref:lipopolysaccharide biosynthesis protein n=1 Tax=Pyranulibacter aquaticus TaxID=3163344 RepID=UPI0035983A97